MKFFTIKRKHILTAIIALVFMVVIFSISTVFGMQHYYNVDFSTGLVTASILNVRSGPGTTYGSPFEMLQSFKISYKTAGENISGNSSNSGAVNAWMNSSGHKANILNSSFNYTGIGVVTSPKYGKVYVQIFIGK